MKRENIGQISKRNERKQYLVRNKKEDNSVKINHNLQKEPINL